MLRRKEAAAAAIRAGMAQMKGKPTAVSIPNAAKLLRLTPALIEGLAHAALIQVVTVSRERMIPLSEIRRLRRRS